MNDGQVGIVRAETARRRLVGGLFGGLLAGSLHHLGPGAAARNKNTKQGKRKSCRKRSPRLATAYVCLGPAETTFIGQATSRFAQTFTTERDGTLARIRFAIRKESATTGDFLVQLVTTSGGFPSNSPLDVLAAVTVPNAAVAPGGSTLDVAFARTPLVRDTVYAAVISSPGSADYGVPARMGDDCPGKAFLALGTSSFGELLGINLVVSVLAA
jgi:hypothetical protein